MSSRLIHFKQPHSLYEMILLDKRETFKIYTQNLFTFIILLLHTNKKYKNFYAQCLTGSKFGVSIKATIKYDKLKMI